MDKHLTPQNLLYTWPRLRTHCIAALAEKKEVDTESFSANWMFDKKYWVMSYWFFIYFLVVLKAKVTIVLFCFSVSFLFICLLFFFLKIIFKTDKTEKLSVDKMYNCDLYLLINNWKKKTEKAVKKDILPRTIRILRGIQL